MVSSGPTTVSLFSFSLLLSNIGPCVFFPRQTNQEVLAWVNECTKMLKPDHVYWCNGSEQEKEELTKHAVDTGVFIPLNQQKLPGCYLHRSNPNDVARVENVSAHAETTERQAG